MNGTTVTIKKKIYIMLAYLLLGLGILHTGWNQSFAAKSTNNITESRASKFNDLTRFVLELDSTPEYTIFTLENPARIVIDFQDTQWKKHQLPQKLPKGIRGIRHAAKDEGLLRVVVDTELGVSIDKHFVILPDDNSSYRFVLDLKEIPYELENLDIILPKVLAASNDVQDGSFIPKPKLRAKPKKVIVIDAGHGGKDPGAIGKRRTKEKTITLAYAKALRDALQKTRRYKVALTRSNDYYIPLRQRVQIGRRAKGDLFISLHADSHSNRRIRGLSVYTLSDSASDKEAAALARKENKSDLIVGLDLESDNDEISDVLIGLAQRDTMNASAAFSETLVKEMKGQVRMLRNPHRFAGFRVLTAADVPSILIELGFLSNGREEKTLLNENYKKKVVNSIVRAIDKHFK